MSAHDILYVLYVLKELIQALEHEDKYMYEDLVQESELILGRAYEQVYGSAGAEHPVHL